MRSTWLLLFLSFILSAIISSAASVPLGDGSDSESTDSDELEEEEVEEISSEEEEVPGGDDLVQENPDYVEPPEVDKKEAEADLSEIGDAKSEIQKTLQQSKSTKRRKQIVKLLKKHSFKLTVLVGIYAFRKEIKNVFLRLVTRRVFDQETGKWVRRPVPFSPTSILKIVIFIDLMRRMQSSGAGEEGSGKSASPLLAFLFFGGRANPALLMFLSKLLSPSNSAYIPPVEQHYTFERINDRYTKDGLALEKAMFPSGRPSAKEAGTNTTSLARLLVESSSGKKASSAQFNETVVVMDLTGLDSSVRQLDTIRDEVSFILSQANKTSRSNVTAGEDELLAELEVVVLLESPGGAASDYALASEQILRLRRAGINVTVCVDKVAASGGYMIACASSPGRLLAAPFAIVGSIGVVGQALNINNALKGWGIRPFVFRAGTDKAPVGLIGDVTREGISKVQRIVDNTHVAFKRHVAAARPVLSDRIDELATGEVWLGHDAAEVGLVDRVVTSDEYIFERLSQGARILKLVQIVPAKYPFSRPTTATALSADKDLSGRLPGVDALLSQAHQFLLRASSRLTQTIPAQTTSHSGIANCIAAPEGSVLKSTS